MGQCALPSSEAFLTRVQYVGIYPPQVKVYELGELSLKFERHLTSEIINFQVLLACERTYTMMLNCVFA